MRGRFRLFPFARGQGASVVRLFTLHVASDRESRDKGALVAYFFLYAGGGEPISRNHRGRFLPPPPLLRPFLPKLMCRLGLRREGQPFCLRDGRVLSGAVQLSPGCS